VKIRGKNMKLFNTVMDLIMGVLSHLGAELALTLYSVLAGIVILLLFKFSSNPARIAAARDRALARVLELWLFREDAVGGLHSVGRAMLGSLGYLASMTPPALVSIVPMLIMLIQANAWFGYRPLREHESVLVTLRTVRSGVVQELQLIADDSATLEATVRAPAINEIAWRLRVASADAGEHKLVITDGEINETKTLNVGKGLARISALRTGSFAEHLFYPDEPLLTEPLERIEVAYQPAVYNFFGLEMPWIIFLLIVSLATGLALKKPFGVEF